MKINLLPFNQRKARCFFCGTNKSVKYAVSADDNSISFKVCNVCVVAERRFFERVIETEESHAIQLRAIINGHRQPETKEERALSSEVRATDS